MRPPQAVGFSPPAPPLSPSQVIHGLVQEAPSLQPLEPSRSRERYHQQGASARKQVYLDSSPPSKTTAPSTLAQVRLHPLVPLRTQQVASTEFSEVPPLPLVPLRTLVRSRSQVEPWDSQATSRKALEPSLPKAQARCDWLALQIKTSISTTALSPSITLIFRRQEARLLPPLATSRWLVSSIQLPQDGLSLQAQPPSRSQVLHGLSQEPSPLPLEPSRSQERSHQQGALDQILATCSSHPRSRIITSSKLVQAPSQPQALSRMQQVRPSGTKLVS